MLDTLVAQLILQERNIAFAVTDQAFRIQQVGGKRALLLANGNGAAPGVSLFDLAPELIGCEAQLQALLTQGTPVFQLEFVNRENAAGETYYVTLHNYGYAADNSAPNGILHIVEDVTFIGETNQRLTQQRNELYLLHEQLRRSNLQLAAANTELRALDELKSKFVSIAAHELRTPLASILGYVDFIINDPVATLHPDHEKGINVIGKSAKRLLAITNNLLDVTRIEAGRIELTLQSLNVTEIVEEVVTSLHPEIEQKQHHFSLEKQPFLPPVLCDETRTAQIFSNLLSNAIKYTPEQGRIVISLRHSPQEEAIIAAVSDTGIGIPTKDLQNIGKNFFRASNVHLSKANGAGLGLSITRSLIELQGGRFWIESSPGQGSTFYLTIPMSDSTLSN
ncbi:MAG: sensor histidine kinase [Caldilinea sp. CFX5]|nr:sensor histidine kinase [Caldilinea sp. CFX5]